MQACRSTHKNARLIAGFSFLLFALIETSARPPTNLGDAERHRMRAHAERGYDQGAARVCLPPHPNPIVPMLRVGAPPGTLRVQSIHLRTNGRTTRRRDPAHTHKKARLRGLFNSSSQPYPNAWHARSSALLRSTVENLVSTSLAPTWRAFSVFMVLSSEVCSST